MTNKEIIIDAAGKPFGRVCSAAAAALRGKNSAAFEPQQAPTVKVKIINAREISFTGKKLENNVIIRHSQHPGGLKEVRLIQAFKKNPKYVIMRSVRLMLPDNRLRKVMLNHLEIT
jgi:large subunit ribosomal protein L13